MPGDVDHVVHAPGDPVVTVLVAARAVAGEVVAGISAKVGIDEALRIAVDAAHLARPAVAQYQIAGACALEHFSVGIDDRRYDAEEWKGRRAGLERRRAR